MAEKRHKTSWEAAAFDKEKGEWVHTTLNSYAHEEIESFPPAQPARITPSRRKPPKRDYKSIFVFSDAQIDYRRVTNPKTNEEVLIPIHDERAMKLAQYICNLLQPDVIVNLGDTVDLAALSRFNPDSDHFHRTLGPSFQRVHDFYAQLRSDNPHARIVEVDSNHNTRLKNFVLKNMPQLYNMHRAGDDEDYPVMSYPYLANLQKLNVEWYSGYGAAEFQYADDLAFIHGTMSTASSSTAAKLSKVNPDRNIVQGHAHRAESFHRTDRKGKTFGAYVVGALCRTDGVVPGFHNAVDDKGAPVHYQENWAQGVMHIMDYGNGQYQFDHILFHERGGELEANYREYSFTSAD